MLWIRKINSAPFQTHLNSLIDDLDSGGFDFRSDLGWGKVIQA